ncbi:RE1, partial [Symbiodinium sp. CCMP2456]
AEAYRGLADARQLGKPEKFSGEPAAFEDWSFVLEAYMCCVNRGFQALFECIRYSDVPVLQASLSPGEAELSTQLFYTLVMLLQDRALDIAQNTDLGSGLEVYRKLVSEYRPPVGKPLRGTLSQLMSHKFTASLEAEIPFFEKLVRRYEAETGKQLDDTIKLGIIINGLQDESLKQHVVRNSARLKTYQLLKDELLEVARTSRVLAEQPVQMDMSALPKWKQKPPKAGKDNVPKAGVKAKEEPEPMLASPTLAEERDYVAAVILPQETIELQKKRGVYWLPVQSDESKDTEPTVLAATKAAKKVVPAEAMSLEEGAGGTAPDQATDGIALENPPKEDSGGPARSSSSRGPENPIQAADRPALGNPPEEDSEAQRKTRSKRIPDLVSEQEYRDPMMTHLPFRSWCDHCVAGKSREDSHPLREARKCKGEVPRFCVDYAFLGRSLKGEMPKTAEALKEPLDTEDAQRPILVMVDQETGATFSYLVTKGVNNYAVHVMNEALKFAGRQRVIIMSDGEPAIRALVDTVARQAGRETQVQHAPKQTHGPSNGAAERAILEVARQARTLVHALETRYPGYQLKGDNEADGKTPYERLKGREYKDEIMDPLAVTGTPWQPKGQALVVPGDNKPLTLPDGRKGRSAGEVKPHSPECRKRFSELYPREAAGYSTEPGEEGAQTVEGDAMVISGAGASGAGGPAQEGEPQGSGGTDSVQSRKDLKKQLADKARGRREAAQQTQEEPKRFRLTQKGSKRTAEVPVEEVETLLAAYPEDGLLESQGAFDERTGEALPVEKVKKARGRELDKMLEHNVKEDITWEEAKSRRLKIVKSRWVDGWKPLPDDPQGVRSRCVAQEVNVSQRDDVASGTPPLKARRMNLSHAATKAPGARANKKLIARYDVSVAFFHAESIGKIAVVPSKDLDQSRLWFLNKAINGTREVSKQWTAKILKNKKKWGFLEIESVPGLFYHPVHDIMVGCHGDDFLASGEKPALEFLDGLMLEEYEVKILPKLGEGYTWEADGKYARLLTQEINLEGGKGVDTPASKETRKNDRFAEEELSPEEASEFRRLAGTALYLSLDRPTIQFAKSDITAGMAKPRRIHMHRLKRLARYLLKFPSEMWIYKYQ